MSTSLPDSMQPVSGPAAGLSPTLPNLDREAFTRDLDDLQAELRETASDEDVRHLGKMERWGRLATMLGYALAWIAPNPISIMGLSFGRFVRWTVIAHPVSHKGYDPIPSTPENRKAKNFAQGWRRVIDWLDWLDPAAWHEEHNIQHHYRLNEEADPDLVERNLHWLRESPLPVWMRLAIVPLLMMTWKFVYYASSSMDALTRAEARREHRPVERELEDRWSERGIWSFLPRPSLRVFLRCWAPYFLFFFVLVPALFLPLGLWAVTSVLINTLLAELLTNIHSFIAIVPNHAGGDLYRFKTRTRSRTDFYLRQIIGSANYRCGGDLNDAMHGWLNYQIEHHLWPDMTMLQYRRAQPKVQELCERHGVPYVMESVWRRTQKAISIMVGNASLIPFVEAEEEAKRSAA